MVAQMAFSRLRASKSFTRWPAPVYNPAATESLDVTSEEELIHRIARAVPSQMGRGKGLVSLGIGDDAAILSPRRRFEWLVSCDAFVEGVHFLTGVHPTDSVGFKSLERAASDLVAMGGRPRFFLLTWALPKGHTGPWLDSFLCGMARAADSLGMRLIGGDTTTGEIVALSITVIGQVEEKKAVTRCGAQPGDLVYVSGKLGRAQLGLELALRGRRTRDGGKRKSGDQMAAILEPHLYPRIRVELGLWLAMRRIPSAMIDLSDGLSTDLGRLCRASRVGAKLYADRIPSVEVPSALAKLLPRRGRLQRALHGGEDYELLFTVPQSKEKKLRRAPGAGELTCIGEVTGNQKMLIVDNEGQAAPLKAGGWDPFR
jgi:thiamine-monophosphate kinase